MRSAVGDRNKETSSIFLATLIIGASGCAGDYEAIELVRYPDNILVIGDPRVICSNPAIGLPLGLTQHPTKVVGVGLLRPDELPTLVRRVLTVSRSRQERPIAVYAISEQRELRDGAPGARTCSVFALCRKKTVGAGMYPVVLWQIPGSLAWTAEHEQILKAGGIPDNSGAIREGHMKLRNPEERQAPR
jgi:hypothetical protein